ncbi:MAG: transposase, partial [Burkholderia sp.]
ANTGQVHAALMTNQNVADGDALAKLLDQIPREEQIDIIGGDGAYDNKAMLCSHCCTQCYSFDSAPRGCRSLSSGYARCGVARNGAVDAIARDGRREWKQDSGYHRRSLAENAMYRFKTLTGNCLWSRHIEAQATEVSIRVGVINRIADLARPQSVRIA